MRITANITRPDDINADIGNVVIISSDAPKYTGVYTVTPETFQQTLYTEGKILVDDVTVKEIPYYEVSNEYNGKTVIIGGK